MLNMLKRTLKKLKGKGAARMLAAVMVSSLLLSSGLGISFASEGAGGEISGEVLRGEGLPGGGQESPEGDGQEPQPENEQTVSAQPENNQTVGGHPENNQTVGGQDVSAQPGEKMTDAVNAFLAATDRLLELAGNDAPAEEMLAAVENARELYENLTEEEKENPEVALRKEALDSFDGVMPLTDVTVTTEEQLRDAVMAGVAANTTVVLGADISLSRTLEVTTFNNITLDLNGKKLSLTGTGSVIEVKQEGITFTLKDSSSGNRGLITGGNNAGYGGGVSCKGVFIMDGGTVSGNTASHGGGVYSHSTFTMNGGKISNNTANGVGVGGGVYCDSDFKMYSGGEISDNITTVTSGSQDCYGSGVYCGQGTFHMYGGTISRNKALTQGKGGGVYCNNSGFKMEGGTIRENETTIGGGVYCNVGKFEMQEGAKIQDNKAGTHGGGVYSGLDTFKMYGGIISKNTAGSSGSDIYSINSLVQIDTSPMIAWEAVDGAYINGWYYDGGYYYNNADGATAARWSSAGAQIFNKKSTPVTVTHNKPLALRAAWHNHSYTTIAPTCTEDGTKTCSCGDIQTIPMLGHSYAGTVTKPPTQTEEGIRTYTCGNDPAHTYTEPISKLAPPEPPAPPAPPHEHSYAQSKAPTCTADGEEKCSCGLTKTLPALGHSYDAGVITKEADCETAGVKTITCSRCNDAKTEELPPVGHKWNNGTVTTAAECEAAGVRTMTCSKCNRTKTEALPALGHRWDNGEITKEPTQTEYGVKTYKCLNNETHIKTEPVEKLKDNGAAANQTNTTNTTNTTGTTNPVNKEQTQEGQAAAAASELTETYTAEIIPDAGYEYPAYRNETPDANDPENPEIIVVIDENGTPLTYRKVEDPDNPGKMIYVEDSSIPLSAAQGTKKAGHWALLNLIMTLVSVLGGIYGLIGYVTERSRKEAKRRGWYLLGAAAALLSVIAFVLTGDMRMTMILADRYTFLMAVLALMQTPGFLQRRNLAKVK